MSFFPEIDLTNDEAKAMARGMLTVAKVDGSVDVREQSLIQEFYDGDLATLDEIPAAEVKAAFSRAAAGELFLKSCLLVALADRYFSDNERKLLSGYAEALGVTDDELRDMQQGVKEYLLRPLSRLANSEAVAQVAQKM